MTQGRRAAHWPSACDWSRVRRQLGLVSLARALVQLIEFRVLLCSWFLGCNESRWPLESATCFLRPRRKRSLGGKGESESEDENGNGNGNERGSSGLSEQLIRLQDESC